MTKIEWTERTWNPVVGCSVFSPGCTNCYAMKTAARLANNPRTPHYHGTIQPSKKGPVWTGKVGFSDSVLVQPLSRKKPTTYFVNSMGDLFHPNVPDEWIDKVFAVMALCPQHTFQVLTKQAERMREYMTSIENGTKRLEGFRDALIEGMAQKIHFDRTGDDPSLWLAVNLPLPNVWLGVSAEDQTRADERIPHLLNTPAAIHFVSAEPLLGPVDLGPFIHPVTIKRHGSIGPPRLLAPALDWVIVGGESGSNARPMHPDWAREIRDQCEAAGVKFLFKQWGEWLPGEFGCAPDVNFQDGSWMGINTLPDIFLNDKWTEDWVNDEFEGHAIFHRVGKKAAGRLLDGREWNDMPEVE